MRFLIAAYIFLLRLTCSVKIVGTLPATPAIYALWHGRLLLAAPLWLQKRPKSAKITMLSSEHKDGRLIAGACTLLGFFVVFGSSTRGGANALRGLLKAAKKGHSLFMTPDGPKGPAQVAKAGVIEAARLTKLPIIPLGLAAQGKTLKSWDSFLAIRPFTTIYAVIGDPITAPKDKATRTKNLNNLEEELTRLQTKAEAIKDQAKDHKNA